MFESASLGRWFSSLRVGALVVIALCGLTCATPDTGPPMPAYTTEAGRACGNTCQATASSCRLGCVPLRRGATTSRQRAQCVEDCNARLAECYSDCTRSSGDE